jgi:ABC-2 type transport system permease protein
MMRSVSAFVRYDLLTQTSYRVRTLLSVGWLVFMAVPVYFVARALQSTMAESISGQGSQYFSFLIVGIAAQRALWNTLNSLPYTIHSGIRTGTLEALFATPTKVPSLVGGMMAYNILWGLFQAALVLGVGWILGARYTPDHALAGLVIALLIVLSGIPFAIMAAAGILSFRTAGPLLSIVQMGSVFLGGVYYPTHIIPSWIAYLSLLFPLTYGLRALRQTVLEGLPITAVMGDLSILIGFILLLGIVAMLLFGRALRYARRSGSLAQY